MELNHRIVGMASKEYKSLKDYLERVTIFRLGRFHVRTHNVMKGDITPFQHTHPFSYMTIILSGGYKEESGDVVRDMKVGGVYVRHSRIPHRILSVLPNTKTLFIAWYRKDLKWEFSDSQYPSPDWIEYPVGMYRRKVFGKVVWSRFDRYWFRGDFDKSTAEKEIRPSINQESKPIDVA